MNLKNLHIKWFLAFVILIAIAFGVFFSGQEKPSYNLPEYVDFNYHIRPLIAQNCFVCHGPDSSSRQAGLRLDIYEGATAKLEDGRAAIVPGSSKRSVLMDRITSSDPDYRMPPPEAHKILTERESALIGKWIDQGAEWKPHWSLIKPEKVTLPANYKDRPLPEIIDFFINRKMDELKVEPASRANDHSLIRRISYLITGLPPSAEELIAFNDISSPENYKKLVDFYLASPHFGERWARHWMDLVRYGEYRGHEYDFPISGAWQYRDYLIRAFNADVPYDLFVKEHLAGDLLEDPRVHPVNGTNESIIGTAYATLGEGKHSPVSVKEEEASTIDNIIDVTSKTFQALTVGCARCHDHKFDPIPTTDYYAMYGMFESTRIGPIGLGYSNKEKSDLNRLRAIKSELKFQIEEEVKLENSNVSSSKINQKINFIDYVYSDTLLGANADSIQIIGDFRNGSWMDWTTEGAAFGAGPTKDEVLLDRRSEKASISYNSYASSRYYTTGIQGALRSPNFIIGQDSIVVRATGDSSTIRVVVDNFQLIQDPLYGSFSKIVDDNNWKDYSLDVSSVKGHKAYLEFLPGYFNQHEYIIKSDNYVDVQYAVAYSSNGKKLEFSIPEMRRTKGVEKPDLIKEYYSISEKVFKSEHLTGMTEGDQVLSPVFIRGNYTQPSKDKVQLRFLSAISMDSIGFPKSGSGRLAWAEAVVDPDNPLTSRVIVNRIWHHVFGRGIVETVDNFGLQGKLPSHLDLLDFLAVRFVEEQWSIKSLLKEILLSDTFKRGTKSYAENQKLDPENISLHHFPIRRLEAEAIRDGILATTGTLNRKLYGQSVPIHLTSFMTGRGRPSKSGPLDGFGRRSVYTEVRRNFLVPMMEVFDMPIPFSTFGKRNETNVPAQSLTLMNDPFVHDQANKWAAKIIANPESTIQDKIRSIYKSAFSRLPESSEIDSGIELLKELCKKYDCTFTEMENDKRLWKDYCHTVFNFKEFIYLI